MGRDTSVSTDLLEGFRQVLNTQGGLKGPDELRTAAGIYLTAPIGQVIDVPLTDNLVRSDSLTPGAAGWFSTNWKNNGWGEGERLPATRSR